jgi:hypothetical protein
MEVINAQLHGISQPKASLWREVPTKEAEGGLAVVKAKHGWPPDNLLQSPAGDSSLQREPFGSRPLKGKVSQG